MRPIDADKVLETMRSNMDMQELYLPTHFIDLVIEDMPTIEVEPVTWYTAAENQPDSVGDDVLIVDRDGKYHVAYYCSKGNWIDTNTGNPIEVIKWRYLDGDSDDQTDR